MIVDIIIIIIIAISILIGIKIGLLKSLINLVSIFLSIIIAMTLSTPFANFLTKNTQIDETIQVTIIKTIIGEDKLKSETEQNNKNDIQKYLQQIESTIDDAKKKMITESAKGLTKQIMIGIAFVILYVATSIILFIIKQFSKILTSLPVIRQFDKIGGGVIGIINAIIIIYISLGVLKVVGATVKEPKIVKEVNKSYIAKIIFDQNPVEKIITSISKK